MSKKRYLITGASGFIGSCLLRRLTAQNENVHILLRRNSDLWRIKDILCRTNIHFDDLSEPERLTKLVNKIKPTVIYHLATYGAYSIQNHADLCIKTNISGTWNLLKATANIDYELFVNTGSSSEYGFKKTAMNEKDCLRPASYYAVTKSSQTMLCSYFANENKKPIVTLRPFSVYGPFEDANRFIPTLLRSLYHCKKIDLVDPHISRDWIYIDDMVNAYILIDKLKKYGGEIFNIGTATQRTIKEVVNLAVKVTGKSADFRWEKMKNRRWDTNYWLADITKAKKLLNWSPQFTLRQGLFLTWDWLNKHPKWQS
jgi:nucleoside-diphosphate-sugar epimerase